MKKLWKKACVLFFATGMSVGTLACGTIGENGRQVTFTADSAEGSWYYDKMWYTMGDEGVFYQDDLFLHFLDVASGQDVILCDKADCKHEEDRENCSGFFEGLVYPIMEDGKILFLSDMDAKELGQWKLYTCDVNGENRKMIQDFSQWHMQNIQDIIWTKDYIVFKYYNPYDENYNELEMKSEGIFVYNRKTKEMIPTWERATTYESVFQIYPCGDDLFLDTVDSDITYEDLDEALEDEENFSEKMQELDARKFRQIFRLNLKEDMEVLFAGMDVKADLCFSEYKQGMYMISEDQLFFIDEFS